MCNFVIVTKKLVFISKKGIVSFIFLSYYTTDLTGIIHIFIYSYFQLYVCNINMCCVACKLVVQFQIFNGFKQTFFRFRPVNN